MPWIISLKDSLAGKGQVQVRLKRRHPFLETMNFALTGIAVIGAPTSLISVFFASTREKDPSIS